MAASCVHHVQLAVRNGSRYVHKLISNVSFKLFAQRKDVYRTDWVLRSGSAVFVVSEHEDEILQDPAASVPLHHRRWHRPERGSEDSPAKAQQPIRIPSSGSNIRSTSRSDCDMRFTHDTYKLGFISPPISLHNIDFNLPENVFGNIDSVCNIAFEVCDVEGTLQHAKEGGAQILCGPTVVKDSKGYVTVGIIKSCVGNVVHTILNTQHYEGIFLPGFCEISDLEPMFSLISSPSATRSDVILKGSLSSDPELSREHKSLKTDPVTHFDHVTFAIPTGTSSDVLGWYERCFGMRRFWLDRCEDELEGFLVRGSNVGLRMKAMQYWHCAETGLVFSQDSGKEQQRSGKQSNIMFVVAEALPHQGPNQVETFIEQHGGAGIQHIGLYTPDIEGTVTLMKGSGLEFMIPPHTYYSEIGKLEEMLMVGKDPSVLQELGILVDAEDFQEEGGDGLKETMEPVRYLMQVFTQPFFDRDTFFLELIQRHGALGFGSGNIKALWRSVEAYMVMKETPDQDIRKTNNCTKY